MGPLPKMFENFDRDMKVIGCGCLILLCTLIAISGIVGYFTAGAFR